MFPDHLARTDPGSFMKGDGVIRPGRFYHTFPSVFHMSRGILHQKTDTVDKLHPDSLILAQFHRNSLFRYEFRLHRGDDLPGSA